MKLLIPILLICLMTGCAKKLATERIEAKTPIEYAMWRSRIDSQMTQTQRHLLDRAMQELKFEVMGMRIVSGSEATDWAFRSRVNGEKLYDVMQYGLQVRLNRLLAERTALEEQMASTAQLYTPEGDDDAAEELAVTKKAQAGRADELKREIPVAENEMNSLEECFH